MAAKRKDLVAYLQPIHDNYRHPDRGAAGELLHQLELLRIHRERMQVLSDQAREMKAYTPPYVISEMRALKALIAEDRRAYRTLADATADAFPGLQLDVEAIPLDDPHLPDPDDDI